jgi:hypothetical protein
MLVHSHCPQLNSEQPGWMVPFGNFGARKPVKFSDVMLCDQILCQPLAREC